MRDAVADRFKRLKWAAQIIAKSYDHPDEEVIRSAENAGCLDELEFILEELRQWLDDDSYYEDVAWNMVHNPESLKTAC